MPTPGQRPSSSSRDLTLVVESESGTPEEYFAQVGLSLGRAKSNTIHIDHPDVDHIHAKIVKRDESFWLQCEPHAPELQVSEPEPGEMGEVEIIPDLVFTLGGIIIRCRGKAPTSGAMDWATNCPVCDREIPTTMEKSLACPGCDSELFWLEADDLQLWIPQRLGDWRVNHYEARGGMGIVLQVVHVADGRMAAIKLLKPEISGDKRWRKRLEQEAEIAKTFVHPNLVHLEDAGHTGGLYWVAFEWVDWGNMAKNIRGHRERKTRMSLEEVAMAMGMTIQALECLHDKGIIHRDIKPANLLLNQEGVVKLADFGLAKDSGSQQSTMLTMTGAVAGTGPYIAPEQWTGQELTPAADIFALGVLWHELLTFRIPGRKLRLEKDRPDCPPQWVKAIDQCLDDHPEERPSLEELMFLIKPFVPAQEVEERESHEDSTETPVPQPEPVPVQATPLRLEPAVVHTDEQNPLGTWAKVTIGVVVLISIGLVIFWLKQDNAKPDPLKKGLVAYYPFNGSAKDESGNGNDGQVKGATLAVDRHGKSRSAYDFQKGDYIRVTKSESLEPKDAITISLWANITQEKRVGHCNFIIKANEGEGYRFRWRLDWPYVEDEGFVRLDIDQADGGNEFKSQVDNAAYRNDWHHYLSVFEGGTGKGAIYIDGKKVGEGKGKGGKLKHSG